MYKHSNQSTGSANSASRRISTNNPFRSALLQEEQAQLQNPALAKDMRYSTSGSHSRSSSPNVDDVQYRKWLNSQIQEEDEDDYHHSNGGRRRRKTQSSSEGYYDDDYYDNYRYNDDDDYDDDDDDANSFTEGDESTHMIPPTSTNRTNGSRSSSRPSKPTYIRTTSDNSLKRNNSSNPFSPYSNNRPQRSNSGPGPGTARSPNNRPPRRERPPRLQHDDIAPPSYDEVVGKKYAKDEYPKDEKINENPFPEGRNPPPRRARTVSSRRQAPPIPSSQTKPKLSPDSMTHTTTTRIMSDGRIRSKSTSETTSPRSNEERSSSRHHRNHADSSRPRRSSHRDRDRERERERDRDRDRDRYYDDEYERPRRSTTSRKKKFIQEKSKNLDTIDRLDVTGFFGGGKFHHDGPFDACTPQRNKDNKAAPVNAFPVDGPNNSIKGMAPTNSKAEQYDMVFGIDQTANDDQQYPKNARSNSTSIPSASANARGYTNGTVVRRADSADLDSLAPAVVQPGLAQVDAASTPKLHGDTTLGLGSTTFMDGTPAYGASTSSNGLQRKKTFLGRMKTIVRK